MNSIGTIEEMTADRERVLNVLDLQHEGQRVGPLAPKVEEAVRCLSSELAQAKAKLKALEDCRDILEKINQGHHLGFSAHKRINAAIAATRK